MTFTDRKRHKSSKYIVIVDHLPERAFGKLTRAAAGAVVQKLVLEKDCIVAGQQNGTGFLRRVLVFWSIMFAFHFSPEPSK